MLHTRDDCTRRLIFVLLLLVHELVTHTQQHCYELKITGIRSTETPDYRLELFLHPNNTLSSITRVLQEVPVPMWHILLMRFSNTSDSGGKTAASKRHKGLAVQSNERMTVLYNSTHKVCDFMRYVKRVRVFAEVPSFLVKTSNMTLSCPLPRNTYVMRNMRIPPETAFLQFVYLPNARFTLTGTVYSQLANKTLRKLSHYDINGTIAKKC